MKKLFKLATSIMLFAATSTAMAHPGHAMDGFVANVAHAFADSHYLLGMIVMSLLVYQLIKRSN